MRFEQIILHSKVKHNFLEFLYDMDESYFHDDRLAEALVGLIDFCKENLRYCQIIISKF